MSKNNSTTTVVVSSLEVNCLFTAVLTDLLFAKIDINEKEDYKSAVHHIMKSCKELDILRCLILPYDDKKEK